MEITGYRRKNGTLGVRNHVLVISSVFCANRTVEKIGLALPEAVAVTHAQGCGMLGDDLAQMDRTMVGFATNPNVTGVLVVGLGCETFGALGFAEKLAAAGQTVECLVVQENGGTYKTTEKGIEIARKLLDQAASCKREKASLADLILSTECGGSDACSGITANPALGWASDRVVEAGGTVILAETPEMIGAEHLLARRAASPEIAQQVLEMINGYEARIKATGEDIRGANPSPGNMRGGITTIEEKSLGCIHKGGHTPVQEVLGYACKPTRKGLVLMDTPGQDVEQLTAMIAGGSQVCVFTTGRGNPMGSPIAPVIKVATNSNMYRRMEDNMDIDAGAILSEGKSVAEIGQRILDEIVAVANGKLTKAEICGERQFGFTRIGPTT